MLLAIFSFKGADGSQVAKRINRAVLTGNSDVQINEMSDLIHPAEEGYMHIGTLKVYLMS